MNGGIFGLQDLNQYELRILNPICGDYRSIKFVPCKISPSSGGIALVQILNILENIDLRKLNHNSEEYLKILIAAMDYAYKTEPNFLEIQIFLKYLGFTYFKNTLMIFFILLKKKFPQKSM